MAHYIGQCPEANLIQTVFGVGWVFREYSRVWPGAQGRHHRGPLHFAGIQGRLKADLFQRVSEGVLSVEFGRKFS